MRNAGRGGDLLAVLLLLFTWTVFGSDGRVCEETILHGRLIINCKSKDLEAVPNLTGYNKQYDQLTLAENRIRNLNDQAFAGLRIKCLDLTGNPLISISDAAFQGLDGVLEYLLLSFDPSLGQFPSKPFEELVHLSQLTVSNNGLTSLPSDSLSSFRNLSKLEFVRGQLSSLSAECFQNQRDTLISLDLFSNSFSSVPTEALSVLRALKSLSLSKNRISRLDAESFRGLSLETLDLSTQSLQITFVDESAFRGLDRTLRNLSLAYLFLTNENVRAIRHLTGIVNLDLSQNRLTHLDGLFLSMRSLANLNLQHNSIISLSGTIFSDASSIRVLNLAYSNISNMDPEAFQGLTSLEDLDLGYSSGLVLNERSFLAQRNTLKYLRLQNSDLQLSQWRAITMLSELHDLFLSECNLENIPDFTFIGMKKLRSIDLRKNRINVLTQKSLAGLESSLEILNLLGNQIQTIDRCVFRGFARMNLFQLSLQQNPLQCDCGLRWLYNWFIDVTRNDNYEKIRISWTCENHGKQLFRELDDSVFAKCVPEADEPPCEDWSTTLPTTSSSTTTITTIDLEHSSVEPSTLSLWLVNVSSDTITLQWDTNENNVVGFSLTVGMISNSNDPTIPLSLDGKARTHQITDLTPQTTYKVCLEIQQSPINTCLNGTTWPASLNMMIVYGASIGGGVAILVLLLILIILCCSARSSRRKAQQIGIEEPKLGHNTKRFQKPPADPVMVKTKSIAEQLQTLTDDERYRLVNLLTNSGGSLASVSYSLNSLPRQRGYVGTGFGTISRTPVRAPDNFYPDMEAAPSKVIYEDIPGDEYYDEISCDEIV